tara:strand:- start:169 stop:711 length:543 start_codon:yes stop_codon:yes gene_type:complete
VPICVIVFKEIQAANDLAQKLYKESQTSMKIQLIKPKKIKEETKEDTYPQRDIETVPLLSPNLQRKIRQKTMAFWLMPFGFITGLTFTKMTGLQTFSNMGFDPVSEPLIGSFLGMASGWIGSYVASASVNPDKKDDIEAIRKLNIEGLWLLLVETPLEIDLPWSLLQSSNHTQMISLNNS